MRLTNERTKPNKAWITFGFIQRKKHQKYGREMMIEVPIHLLIAFLKTWWKCRSWGRLYIHRWYCVLFCFSFSSLKFVVVLFFISVILIFFSSHSTSPLSISPLFVFLSNFILILSLLLLVLLLLLFSLQLHLHYIHLLLAVSPISESKISYPFLHWVIWRVALHFLKSKCNYLQSLFSISYTFSFSHVTGSRDQSQPPYHDVALTAQLLRPVKNVVLRLAHSRAKGDGKRRECVTTSG